MEVQNLAAYGIRFETDEARKNLKKLDKTMRDSGKALKVTRMRVESMQKQFGNLGTSVNNAAKSSANLYKSLTKLSVPIRNTVTTFKKLGIVLKTSVNAWNNFEAGVQRSYLSLVEAGKGLKQFAKDLIIVTKAQGKFTQKLSFLGSSIKSNLTPSILSLVKGPLFLLKGIFLGITSLAGTLAKSVGVVLKGAFTVLGNVLNIFVKVARESFNLLKSLLSVVGSIGKSILTLLNPFALLTKAIQKIASVSPTLASAFSIFLSGQLVQTIRDTGDAFIFISNRVRLVTKTMTQQALAMDRVYKIAIRTRSSFFAVADLFSRVGLTTEKLGISMRQVAKLTEAVGKSAQISGTAARTYTGALIQLGQAFSIGVLRGDEFRSVQEALPALMQQVADRMGVTRGQLRELAYQGKLTSRVLVDTILKSAGNLDKQFAKIKPTIGSAIEVVRTAFTRLVGRINESTGIFNKIAQLILDFGKYLDSIPERKIKMVQDFFVLGLGKLKSIGSSIVSIVDNLSTKVVDLVVNFAKLNKGETKAETIFAGYIRAVTTVLATIKLAIDFIPNLITRFAEIGKAGAKLLPLLKEAFVDTFKALFSKDGILVKRLKKFIEIMQAAVKDMVKNLADSFKFTVAGFELPFEVKFLQSEDQLYKRRKDLQERMSGKASGRKPSVSSKQIMENEVKKIDDLLAKRKNVTSYFDQVLDIPSQVASDVGKIDSVQRLKTAFDDVLNIMKISGTDLKKELKQLVEEILAEEKKVQEATALILYRSTEAGSAGFNAPRGALGRMKRLQDLRASERRKQITGPFGATLEAIRGDLPTDYQFSASGFSTRTGASKKDPKKTIDELSASLEKYTKKRQELDKVGRNIAIRDHSQEMTDLGNTYIGVRDSLDAFIASLGKSLSSAQFKKFDKISTGIRQGLRLTNIDMRESKGVITADQAESEKAKLERAGQRLVLQERIKNLTETQQAFLLADFDIQTRMNDQLREQLRINRELEASTRRRVEARRNMLPDLDQERSSRGAGQMGAQLDLIRRRTRMRAGGASAKDIAKLERKTAQRLNLERLISEQKFDQLQLSDLIFLATERELEVIERQAEIEKEKVRLKRISEQTSSLEDQLQVLRLQEKLIKRGTDRVEIERRLAYLKVQQAEAAEIAATSSEKEIKAIREKYRLEFDLIDARGRIAGLDRKKSKLPKAKGEFKVPEVANIQKEIGEAVVGFLQDTSKFLIDYFRTDVPSMRDIFAEEGPGTSHSKLNPFVAPRKVEGPGMDIYEREKAQAFYGGERISAVGFSIGVMAEKIYDNLSFGFSKVFSFVKEGFSKVFGFLKDTFLNIVPKGAKAKGILDAMGITFKQSDKDKMAQEFANSMIGKEYEYRDPSSGKMRTGIYDKGDIMDPSGQLKSTYMTQFESQLKSKGLEVGGLNQGGQQLAGQFGGMIAGAGPNAARGMQVAQATAAGGPIAGIAAMVLSNEKVKESLDKLLGLIMDIFDGLIAPFVEMFSGFVDMIEPVLKMIAMMLKPFKMIFRYLGNFLRILGVMFVKIMRPLAKIMEALKPAIEFLGEVLMYVAEIINVIASFFGSVISFITGQGTANEATDEFSLEYEQGILHTFMDTISSIADNMKTIEDAMKAIETSALNLSSPATKLEEQAATYQELLAAAKKEGATSDDIKEFSSFAKTYLQNAKDIFKSSEAYTSLYDQVLSDMKSIGDAVKEDRVYQEAVAKANTYLEALGSTFSIGLEDSIFTVIQKVEERLSFLDEQLSAKQYSEFDFGGTGGDYSVDTSSTGETGFSLGGLWDAIVQKLIDGLSWVGSGLGFLWEKIKSLILGALGYDGDGISIPIIPNPFDWNNPIFKIDLKFDEGGDVPIYAHGGNVASSGGYAVGPSHQSGMLGMTRDGSPFLFEGGEYIINKKSVDKLGVETLEFVNSLGDGGPTPGSNRMPEYGIGGTLYEAFRKDLILSLGNTKPSAGVEEAFNQLTSGSGYVVFGNRSRGQGSMLTSEGDAITGDQGSMIGYSQEFDKSTGMEASIKNPIAKLYGTMGDFMIGEKLAFLATEHTPGGEDISKMGIRAGGRLNLPQWWNTKVGFDIMPPTNRSLDDVSFTNILGMFDSGGYVGTPSIDEYYNSIGGSKDRFTEQAFKAAGMTKQDDYIVTGRPGTLLRAGIIDTTYPVIDGGMPIPFTDKEVFLKTQLGLLDFSKSSAEMGTRKRLMPGGGMDPFLVFDWFAKTIGIALPIIGDAINSMFGLIFGSTKGDPMIGKYKPGILELLFGDGGRDYAGERKLAKEQGRDFETEYSKGNKRGLGMGIFGRLFDAILDSGLFGTTAFILSQMGIGTKGFNKQGGDDGKLVNSKGEKVSYKDLYNPVDGERGIGAAIEGMYKEVINSEVGKYVGGMFKEDGSLARGADGLGSGEWFFTLASILAPYYFDEDSMRQDQKDGIYKDREDYVKRNRIFKMKELDFVADMPMQAVDFMGHVLKYMTQGEAATKLGRGGFGEFFFDIFDLIFNFTGDRRTRYDQYNNTARSSLEKGGTRRVGGYASGGMIPKMPSYGLGDIIDNFALSMGYLMEGDPLSALYGRGPKNQRHEFGKTYGGQTRGGLPNIIEILLGMMGLYGYGGMAPSKKIPEAGAGSLIIASALMGALSGLSMSRRSDDISDFEGAVLGGTLGAFGGNDILTSLLFIDTFDRGSRGEISAGQALLQLALLAGLGEAKIASDSYAASGPGGIPPYYRFLDSLGLAGLYGMGGMTPYKKMPEAGVGSFLGDIAESIGNTIFGARSEDPSDTGLYGGLLGTRGLMENISNTISLPFTENSGMGIEGILQFFLSDLLFGRDQGQGYNQGGIMQILSTIANLPFMPFEGKIQGQRTKEHIEYQKKLGSPYKRNPRNYAVGGPVYGPSHAQGGVLAELEGGEYVIPKNVRMMQTGGSAAVTGGSGYASRSGSGASQMTGAGGGGSDFARLEQVLLSWLEQFESLLLGPDGFLPGLKEEVKNIVDGFIEGIEKLLGPLSQLYTAFAIIAAIQLGALFTSMATAIYAFLVGPFAAFVAAYWPVIAVIAAIAAVYLIYQNNVEYFNEKLTDLIETIQAISVAMLFFVTLPFTISAAIVKAIVDGFTNGFSGVNLGEIFGDLLGSATGIEGFRASFFNYGRWFGMGDKFLIDIPISWEEGDTWKKYFREGGYMSGPSHEAGGIPIEVEGGEWIISKKAVDFWGSDVFKFLNEAKLPQFGNGNEVNWDQKQTASKLNSFGISGGISTDDFLGGAARDLWNRLVGEKYVEAGIDLAPNPGAYLRQNIFKNGGDTSKALEATSTVTEKFFGFKDRVGSNITGYVEAALGLMTPQMKPESSFSYDPPRIGGGGLLGGRVVPGILAEGGHIDPMVVGLLTELVDAVREGQDTEVNVFTDLRGESRAAVTDFRSEIRERDLRGLRTA